MKIEWNQVTWYSKLAALGLLVALPFAGFYAGVSWQKAITPAGIVNNPPVATNSAATKPPISSQSSTQTKAKTQITTNRMSITAVFENGVLKYSGTVELPNPCYEIIDQTQVTRTDPQVVNISLKTQIKPSLAKSACAQMIVEQPFSGAVMADANATINVYLNDQLVK